MCFRLSCLLLTLVCGAPLAAAPAVAILANSDDPDSLEVARHYAKARDLPADNIIALPMPLTEQISWPEFVLTIHRPLQDELVRRGWIDAIAMDLEDEAGRRKLAVNAVPLSALVVCRGVPLKIAGDKELGQRFAENAATPSQFQTNAAAVDSELALIALPDLPINGFVPNPAYGKAVEGEASRLRIIPVGRLDGPTVAHACALVDNAIKAEREGLFGRAYVDIGGPHAQGDQWLRACVEELAKTGFAPDVDTDRATLSAGDRFDAPVFYFGWYTGSVNGPMRDPKFRFPAGAVALHIHSFSASTMRNGNGPWAPAMVARGVTLTVGNVYEPYLQFTHQPQRLFAALAAGLPAGEAALSSLNALSWQAILVGDPLYRPFKVSLDEQWTRVDRLPVSEASYLYLRKINLLESEGLGLKARSLAFSALRKSPSLPVVLELARLQLEADDKRAALRTLAIIGGLRVWKPEDAPLIAKGARMLVDAGDGPEAVKWFLRLLGDDKLTPAMRRPLLAAARDTAKAALDFIQAGRWEQELNPPKNS